MILARDPPSAIAAPPSQAMDAAGLHAAIRAFVSSASYEMTAADLAGLEAAKEWLPPDATLFVTALPHDTPDMQVRAARALTDAGYVAVPHLAARRIASEAQLDRLLVRLSQEAGVRRALLIAGDTARAEGPFSSTLQLLRTGLFERRGFSDLAIAGYPEEHRLIPHETLWSELDAKLATGWRGGIDMRVVTQFCFDAAPIANWLRRFRAHHAAQPVRIGLAGPADLRTLLRYARVCGIGSSMRSIAARGASIARLLTEAGPDPVIRALMADPSVRGDATAGLHFFSFGGLARTARWADRVARGEFALSHSEPGFTVS